MLRRLSVLTLLAALAAPAQDLAASARRQIAALLAEKSGRNPAQAKIDSHLVHAASILRGVPVHRDFPAPPGELEAVHLTAGNSVEVDLNADVTPALLAEIAAAGGTVVNAFPEYQAVRATLPLLAVERIAGRGEVRQVRMADPGHSNAGPDISGDIAHQVMPVRQTLHYDGSGVKIGVLSDGVNSLGSEQAAHRLPALVNVLPGQAGNGDEGTALLEIIYTLAPGATLYYATAQGGQAAMANNVVALANAGCNIIIDDWTYFAEGVFEDDLIARKVNQVAAAGVFYFSDAQNSGSALKLTTGTWEGDFQDSGQRLVGAAGTAHNFGTADNVISYDVLTVPAPQSTAFTGWYELKWSDPLGASNNDYDLFILDSNLTTVLASSTNVQNGWQNPEEYIPASTRIPSGSRIVIVKHDGAAVRALHLDTERGQLAIGTNGATFGHNAAAGAFTVGGVDARSAGGGAFLGGAANPGYAYSSDGPRRMLYNTNGTAITPDNVLFSTNGGTVLEKPDITAAQCVPTGVPGWSLFCGTSASAAHAAAIAAVVLQAKPGMTVPQMRTAFGASALDIEGTGFDVNSGVGIVMAPAAVSAATDGAPASISSGGVVNAASYAATVAPGSLAAAFGAFPLSSSTVAAGPPYAQLLSGLSVSYGSGANVPVYFVSPSQVNLQVPWELAGEDQTTFTAATYGYSGPAQTVQLAAFAPGIFSTDATGAGQGAILDPSYRLVNPANPAIAGTTVVAIYCTGLGRVRNQPASGAPAPVNPLAQTPDKPVVTIGGATADVWFSGLAPGWVGLYQVNAMVPAGSATGDAVPVTISMGGVTSNTVTIAVAAPPGSGSGGRR